MERIKKGRKAPTRDKRENCGIVTSLLDACSGYLIFKKLQDVLIARRTVKEQMTIISKLENCGLIAEKINAANNQAKRTLEESRSYCPRSDIDIFD